MTSSTEEKVCLDVVCLTASALGDVNSLLPTLLACTRMAIELQSD
ncbi:MAG: hypothetical protein R3C56_31890 [Pirellulaceae bacterium]